MSFINQTIENYKNLGNLFQRYWRNYGGASAFISSPYFHISVVFGILFFPIDATEKALWWDIPLEIMPSIIGFSLGGYAILFAVGDEGFRELLGRDTKDSEEIPSPLVALNTTFFHFILIQLLSLILALIAKTTNFCPHEFRGACMYVAYVYGIFSYIIFFYAIFSAAAATVELYRSSIFFDRYLGIKKKNEKDSAN